MRLGRLILAAAGALLPTAVLAQAVPITLAPSEVLMNVEARGEYRSRPDVMTITAGVVTTGKTARQALAANNALADRLYKAIKAAGVEPRDVQTSELSVDPQVDAKDEDAAERENREQRIVGYMAKNKITLTLRDLARAPEIIDSLFAAGANSVDGPRFSLADPKPAEKEARRAAVAEARAEAETYADAVGMRVGRILRISERGEFAMDGGDAIVVTGTLLRLTPVEPGQITTRIGVWIDYALVPR